jgi:hypothetical protein
MSGGTVLARHKQFIKERQYVNNVSPATVQWYEQSLCWLDTETPTTEDINTLIRLRERGLEPISIRGRPASCQSVLPLGRTPCRHTQNGD